ncbi:MAG: PAS domain-containing protein, partial [Methanoregula sp.]|nr:PAS domain-containing protein [Methanoregula sp.]
MVLSPAITTKIKGVLTGNPQGLSITDIVALAEINRNTAGRYLENLLVSGQVEMRQFGMAKIYTLTQRVPVSAVLSISSELIMQLDKNLRIIFANEPFLSFLSVSATDLFGKNIEYSRVLPVFEEIYSEFVDRIRSGIAGTEWSGELALKERGIIFSCHIAPTVFDNGQKGVSVILEDISGKKRADEALKASEDRFRRIFKDGPLGMGIVDLSYRLTNVNRKLCRMLGYSREELLTKSLLDITHPAHVKFDLVQVK